MSAKILLITVVDETHRKPLLESQGYMVQTAKPDDIERELGRNEHQLALIGTDNGVAATLEICERMKNLAPELRIGVIAQRSEYVPANSCVDAIIREQHTPRKFLAAVKKLADVPEPNDQSFLASEGG